MKINICQKPPVDIFKNRRKYTLFFIGFLTLACFGLLLGTYAILSNTRYYEKFEIASLTLFTGSALFITYFGQKLQAYKKLFPPQQEELEELKKKYDEIKIYCERVAKANRPIIRGEYEACQAFATQKDHENS